MSEGTLRCLSALPLRIREDERARAKARVKSKNRKRRREGSVEAGLMEADARVDDDVRAKCQADALHEVQKYVGKSNFEPALSLCAISVICEYLFTSCPPLVVWPMTKQLSRRRCAYVSGNGVRTMLRLEFGRSVGQAKCCLSVFY